MEILIREGFKEKRVKRSLIIGILKAIGMEEVIRCNQKVTHIKDSNTYEYEGFTIEFSDDWCIKVFNSQGAIIRANYQKELTEHYLEIGIWYCPMIEKLKELYPTIHYIVKD